MSENKTKLNDADPIAYLNEVEDEGKRQDSLRLLEMMREATGEEPKMWGDSIVGFGSYRYKYASGREGDWLAVGFAPRKRELTLYIMPGFSGYDELMAKLGKFKTGKSCLYIKRLADVDMEVLRELVERSVVDIKRRYPS